MVSQLLKVKYFLLLTGVFISFCPFSYSQKEAKENRNINPVDLKEAKAYYPDKSILLNNEKNVKEYLREEITSLKNAGTDISSMSIIESPSGIHYTYLQTYLDNEVYNAQIKINLDKKGKILSIFDYSYSIETALSRVFPDRKLAENLLSDNTVEYKISKVYFPVGTTFVAALKAQVADNDGTVIETIIDKNGEILYTRDLNIYFSMDTAVTAGVFLPNPLISAGVSYGAPYEDANDGDVPELNAQIVQVSMKAKFTNDTFKLESPWAKITEHSSPVTTPATSTIPEFNFTRSQLGFEDVNAFYHINKFQLYIQSLGFINLANYQIHIDAHALNGADQSSFTSFFTPHRLNFGTGGVDDAEDAHVIIHEYGHAIMQSAAPNTNNGSERTALDEANGDYFAVSYSKSINPYDWYKVFSWDGHNTFWAGRNAASGKKYPGDLSSSFYQNSEIWSSTLMQINAEIGRELTDKILLQSAYSYYTNMKMSDAAMLFLQADTLLTGGANNAVICNVFNERGLYYCNPLIINEVRLNAAEINVSNSAAFAKGSGDAAIYFSPALDATIEVFDLTGRLMDSIVINRRNPVYLSPLNFKPGIYFLKFPGVPNNPVIKLIRF